MLQQGLISPSDLNLFKITHSIEEAEAEILQFYKNFHSYRWVREAMVIRIRHRVTEAALEKINRDFGYLLADGSIVQGVALPEEAAEVQLAELPRIILTPTKHDFGGIRALIDAINAAETE